MQTLFFINFFSGRNNVVATILSDNNDNFERWLTLKLESKRETLIFFLNYNFNLRIQTSFVEDSCEIKIENIQKDTRTQYKATARNFGHIETL